MPRVLVVHHTPSPGMQQMLEAVLAGTRDPELDPVDVVVRSALRATASDVFEADAFLLGSPVNIGYISGALKHFFDQVYYPTLLDRRGAPFGLWLHGSSDATGAVRAVDAITTGLGWQRAHEDVIALGTVDVAIEDRCHSLGATLAALAAT
ncbi:flavodoxin family protein [Microbacterium gorillae]|uniref:flavodoxin family protein n=1 Tax=Microbacterium gorillae TaxID=1231063 RepID=UPI00058CECD9|nr:NAD(P)H-dependent oxidoreductase [Microbacterium gorillae]